MADEQRPGSAGPPAAGAHLAATAQLNRTAARCSSILARQQALWWGAMGQGRIAGKFEAPLCLLRVDRRTGSVGKCAEGARGPETRLAASARKAAPAATKPAEYTPTSISDFLDCRPQPLGHATSCNQALAVLLLFKRPASHQRRAPFITAGLRRGTPAPLFQRRAQRPPVPARCRLSPPAVHI